MKFNHISEHHWNEARLVFRFMSPTAKLFAQAEETELPTEYVLGQDILKSRIDEIDKEMGAAGKRKKITSILSAIGVNKDWSIDELRLKKEACQKKLEELKSSINNPFEFRNALNDIDSYEETLKKLSTPEFDYVDLQNLTGTDSDFGAFFGKKLSKKLESAREMMTKRERAISALMPQKSNPRIAQQAESEWESSGLTETRKGYKMEWINHRIAELEAEKEVTAYPEDNQAFLGTEGGQHLDEGMQKLIREQAESGKAQKNKKEEVHSLTIKREDQNSILLGNILSREDKIELANILLEAKEIKTERVKTYLAKRLEDVAGKFKTLKGKKPPRVSEAQVKDTERFLNGFKDKVLGNPQLYRSGTKALMQAFENLNHVETAIDDMAKDLKFVDEMAKDPERFKAGILKKVGLVKSAMALMTPTRVDAALKRLDEQERARIAEIKPGEKTKHDEFGKSPAYLQNRNFWLSLKNPQSDFMKIVAETEKDIARFDEMSQEEQLDFVKSLDMISARLSKLTNSNIDKALGLEKRTEADLARHVIELIKDEEDPEKIKTALNEHLGKEHYQLLSGAEFANYKGSDSKTYNLNEYTGGSMVFYERGNEWKFLINKDVLSDGKSLKEQLTHELLHLEFENNKELRDKWLEIFTNNPKWNEIESIFISSFPNKKPPVGDKWKPEHILSEIYAMQNDVFAPQDDKYKNIFNAIAAAGITAEVLGLPEKFFNAYKDGKTASQIMENQEAEAQLHGFEGGGGGGKGKDDELAMEGAESGVGNAESYKEEIDKQIKEIKRLQGTDYIQNIPGGKDALEAMATYHEETSKLNDSLEKEKSSLLAYIIGTRIKQIKGSIDEIEKKIAEVAEHMDNTHIGFLRNLWNNSQFMSLDDVFQVGHDMKEWWLRRHKRRKEDHAARIGSALFDKIPIPIASEFGVEASARWHKAEEAEVHEWQGRLAHKDAWELIEIVHKLAEDIDPNKDLFKAVIRQLAEKGRINWRDPKLWRLLNKLQNGVYFDEKDVGLQNNANLLRQSMHKAFGEIYDYDEYLNLDRKNTGNYAEGKKKYFGIFKRIQNQLTDRLDQLLAKKRELGAHAKIDPMEYEGVIEYSIMEGKSSPEAVCFYLMTGIAEGILSADRPLALDSDYINKWPALQWFYSKRPALTKSDYINIINKNFPNDGAKGQPGKEFKNFYWTQVLNDDMAVQRVRKAVGMRTWDHDWARSIAPLGDAGVAKVFLSFRSGQQEAQATAIENTWSGALMWLEENGEKIDKIDFQRLFSKNMSWVAMADGILSNAAYVKQNFARFDASMLNSVAREEYLGNHEKNTVAKNRDMIRSFLDIVDPVFFSMIRDAKKIKEKPAEVVDKIKSHLTTNYSGMEEMVGGATEIDNIYDQLDGIIKNIVTNHPPDLFMAKVKQWRAMTAKQ